MSVRITYIEKENDPKLLEKKISSKKQEMGFPYRAKIGEKFNTNDTASVAGKEAEKTSRTFRVFFPFRSAG